MSNFLALLFPYWSGLFLGSSPALGLWELQALAVCVTVGGCASLSAAASPGCSSPPPLEPAVSMSLPRCALLWARLPTGRQAGHRAAFCSALRAHTGPFPGALGRVPAIACASSSASGGSKAPNTSLFVPLTVKPQGPSADGDVGAELTRPLDKSECRSWRGRRGWLVQGWDASPRKLLFHPLETQVPSNFVIVPQCLPPLLVLSPSRLGIVSDWSFDVLPLNWHSPFHCSPGNDLSPLVTGQFIFFEPLGARLTF